MYLFFYLFRMVVFFCAALLDYVLQCSRQRRLLLLLFQQAMSTLELPAMQPTRLSPQRR